MTKKNQIKKQDLVVTRIIDAPVELVWKAWTDPECVMRWWGPKDYISPSCKIDFREGGNIYFVCARRKNRVVRICTQLAFTRRSCQWNALNSLRAWLTKTATVLIQLIWACLTSRRRCALRSSLNPKNAI
ncbi:MAG: SRPBCC domain-containing protein [Candidatus Methanoperedens sp.]|nr:SRPBCC domain-containing protein [Candidatus Methanoperedens sp.]MCE8427607.1 SRPBCC domain-containing protein [Candidatus Methanoperedens sp.]